MGRGARSALRLPLPARCSLGRPPSVAMPRKYVRCGSRVDHRATAQRPVGLAGSASELPSTTSEHGSRPTKGWRTWAPSSRGMEKLSTLHVLRVTSPYHPRRTDREDRRHAGATDLNPHALTHDFTTLGVDSKAGSHMRSTHWSLSAHNTRPRISMLKMLTLCSVPSTVRSGAPLSTGRWEAGSCHQRSRFAAAPAAACLQGSSPPQHQRHTRWPRSTPDRCPATGRPPRGRLGRRSP